MEAKAEGNSTEMTEIAVTAVGYQGAAAHTFTTGCDGFHLIGEQCNLPADPHHQQPAKVIVVERDGHPARLFAASTWEVLTDEPERGDLMLHDKDDYPVVQLGARTWDSVCKAESILPADLYARHAKKLTIAHAALRDVADEPHVGYGPERAARALAEIEDDL